MINNDQPNIYNLYAPPKDDIKDIESTESVVDPSDWEDEDWEVECGKHNPAGEGEWPHACIVYHKVEMEINSGKFAQYVTSIFSWF